MTTNELLRELAALDAKATSAPWERFEYGEKCEHATVAHIGAYSVGVPTPGYPGGNYRDTDFGDEGQDADLIAALRNNLPMFARALSVLAAVERMLSYRDEVFIDAIAIMDEAAEILEAARGK